MLSPVDSYAFVHDGAELSTYNRFDRLVSEVYSSKAISIRDAMKIKGKLDQARDFCFHKEHGDLPCLVVNVTVLPLLVFIEQEDTDLFRRITQGIDLDALYECGNKYPSFSGNVVDTICGIRGGFNDAEDDIFCKEDCKAYMHDLCMVLYGSDKSYSDYYEARNRIGGSRLSELHKRVYRQLKFD